MKMDKLLVVDDDPDILDMMQLVLTSYGYHTEVASRGEEVYDKVQEYQPDLIILDYFLSGTDGTAICRFLKSTEDTKHVPVIMFSAHPAAEGAARKSGAEGFISKPFSVQELLSEIKRHTGAASR